MLQVIIFGELNWCRYMQVGKDVKNYHEVGQDVAMMIVARQSD
jgi:hypothetical protein